MTRVFRFISWKFGVVVRNCCGVSAARWCYPRYLAVQHIPLRSGQPVQVPAFYLVIHVIISAISSKFKPNHGQIVHARAEDAYASVRFASSFSFSTSFSLRKGLKPRLCPLAPLLSSVIGCSVTYIPWFVITRYVPLGTTFPTISPLPSTSTLPRISSGHAIRPKSGGFLESLRCTWPPLPAPPAPPCALAPPAPPSPLIFLRERFGCETGAPGPAKARAWEIRSGSLWALSSRTALRTRRKRGFSEKELGVGGTVVVVPMERVWIGALR